MTMARPSELLPAGVRVFERGWLSSNNVLVIGDEDAALIDSGYASHADLTLSLVRGALDQRRLATLVNTHLHSDHCGGNAALQAAFPDLRTLVPPGQADAVRRWDPIALTYTPTGQACPRFAIDGVLVLGTEVRLGNTSWQVHAAPGHDQHSVILFEPLSRTLVSADALWQNGFGVVFQELEGERAFDEVAATFDLIASLEPAVVIPGHGSLFSDVDAALERARSRLEAFQADPARHATHAAKVLVKFRLLERQEVALPELEAWAGSTAYFRIAHERWFADRPFQQWMSQLLAALVKSGAVQQEAGVVRNI